MKRKLNQDEKLVVSMALLVVFLAGLAVMFSIYKVDRTEKHPNQQTGQHA